MSLLSWLLLFLALAFAFTYLVKRFTRHQTWYIASLIRTKKPLALFDYFSRAGAVLDLFADIGLVLGFGAFAVDFLFGRKLRAGKRVLLFAVSAGLLTLFFFLVDSFLGGFISSSPMTKNSLPLIAVVFGFSGFAGFTILLLVMQGADIIAKLSAGKDACPGIAPLIPGVKIPNVPITIPLHAWFSLLIILLVHEGMHGIVARRQGFRVKSAGLLLLGFLPIGAFVEPDEKEVRRAGDRKALRLFAAGPAANLLLLVFIKVFVFAVALGLLFAVSPWYSGMHSAAIAGVAVESVDENVAFCGEVYPSPAYGVLEGGMLIKKANDENISSVAGLQFYLSRHRDEQITLLVETAAGQAEKTLTPNELGGFGFAVADVPNPAFEPPLVYVIFSQGIDFLDEFLGWLFVLSLLVALANFLPLAPFDGGRIAEIIFSPFLSHFGVPEEKRKPLAGRIFLVIVLSLFAVNALPLFV